jgi:hypothetical protein
MSAFVMERTGYDTLANHMYCVATSSSWSQEGAKRAILCFLFDDLRNGNHAQAEEVREAIESRMNELIAANYDAVNQRYDEDEAAETFNFHPRLTCPAWSDIQVIKHLECLRYQLSEGDVPAMAIYGKLEKLISGLSEAAVRRLNAYDKASWGW